MEQKDSEEIVGAGESVRETSGETILTGTDLDHSRATYMRSLGINIDPSRALLVAGDQTGGAVAPAHESDGPRKAGIDLDPSPALVPVSHRPGGVAPSQQTGGTSRNLGASADHQTGGAVAPANQTNGPRKAGIDHDPSRASVCASHHPGGVAPSQQTGGTAQNLGARADHQTGGEHYVKQAGIEIEPARTIAGVGHEPGGVAPSHQPGGVYVGQQTHGHQAGGSNQTHGVQETSERRGERPQMPKVPTYIRQKYNSEDYEPLVASFGPYNEALHNAPDQRLALVEEFKAIALEWFISGTGKDANYWFRSVWSYIRSLQSLYTPESTEKYSYAEFTRLMLQDVSLAILIMGVANQEQQDIELLYNHLGAATVFSIIRDSFLLENQLPFGFVRDMLRHKFGFFKGEARWKRHFIISCHGSKARADATNYWDEEAGDPGDFVEALKTAHLSGWKRENTDMGTNAIDRDKKKEEQRIVLIKDYYTVHSVTELKAKGITVRPNSTNSFKNITFQSGYFSGTLHLPIDFVNYGTKAVYSNIIAYEMSHANHTQDYTMTAYVHLMKSLLQSPNDVEELQANGIIINMLGSNEQVMNLYRDIYTFGINCSSKYGEICQQMEEHYNNKTKTWFAEFLYTYFRSPWTVIALFGSILVVALTFIQTYYSVNQ